MIPDLPAKPKNHWPWQDDCPVDLEDDLQYRRYARMESWNNELFQLLVKTLRVDFSREVSRTNKILLDQFARAQSIAKTASLKPDERYRKLLNDSDKDFELISELNTRLYEAKNRPFLNLWKWIKGKLK